MSTLFAVCAILLYFLAAAVFIGKFVHSEGPNKKLGFIIASVSILAHLGFLLENIWVAPGQDMSVTNVLSLVAWIICTAMVAFATVMPNIILLPVVFVFSAFTVAVSWLVPSSNVMDIQLLPGLVIHITLSLLAYCILVMAFLYALQMSYITHKLKEKAGVLLHSSLPPLMAVESILFKLMLVGTLLLFISLGSGFVFLDNMLSTSHAHKTVLSIIALGIFSTLLIGQKLKGWRGKQVIVLTIVGVMFLSLAYFGSKLVREFLL